MRSRKNITAAALALPRLHLQPALAIKGAWANLASIAQIVGTAALAACRRKDFGIQFALLSVTRLSLQVLCLFLSMETTR